jgi:hypothetical protein
MSAKPEDSLRQHLDAVDRYERKHKWIWRGSSVVAMSLYAAWFYLTVHEGGTPRVRLLFGMTLAFIAAAAINGLYFHIAHMTNRVLKAIELSSRESK